MAYFICAFDDCRKDFKSKHSTAQYCSRTCAGKGNSKKNKANPRIYEKMYSREQLLEFIHNWVNENGSVPTIRQFRKKNLPTSTTYSRTFGSWQNAVREAGYEPHMQYPKEFYLKDRNKVKLSLRFEVLQRDNFSCVYCGGTPNRGYVLHVDHVLAVSKGGKTVKENLITACVLCNWGKSDSPLAPVV